MSFTVTGVAQPTARRFFWLLWVLGWRPIGAIARTIAAFEALATKTPKTRMTSAFSDGEILYAGRYASDGVAPTLYHRWSTLQKGRVVVSEPFDAACGLWQEVPDKIFCVFERQRVQITTL